MKKLVKTIPKEAEYYFRVAMDAENKESPVKVLEYFDRAINSDPGYVPAWNEKANFLDLIQRYDEALVMLRYRYPDRSRHGRGQVQQGSDPEEDWTGQ